MRNLFTPILLAAGLACAFCGDAFAQSGGPLQLPTKPSPAASAINHAATPPRVATQDAAVLIQKANAWLNAATVMSGDFMQIGADGKKTEGKIYVQRPGRMRFAYDPPAVLDVIADGTSVAVRNRKLATQDLYFIGQTPLKFLLKDRIDIARDTKIIDVSSNATATSILIEDKATFGGTSRIRLVFDPQTSALKQWTVIDPQGAQTIVSLSNLDTASRPDPSLFKINQETFRD